MTRHFVRSERNRWTFSPPVRMFANASRHRTRAELRPHGMPTWSLFLESATGSPQWPPNHARPTSRRSHPKSASTTFSSIPKAPGINATKMGARRCSISARTSTGMLGKSTGSSSIPRRAACISGHLVPLLQQDALHQGFDGSATPLHATHSGSGGYGDGLWVRGLGANKKK